ncbi:hypothetical protein Tco_1403738 [Tanacetum coccineum]
MRIQDGGLGGSSLRSTSAGGVVVHCSELLLEAGCPPQDPDKLDQLQMKLDHLLEQETNHACLPLKDNHCPRKETLPLGSRVQDLDQLEFRAL